MTMVAFETVADTKRGTRRQRRAPDAGAKLLGLSPLALLAACGGGGGTDPLPPPPEPFTGRADAMAVPVGNATATGNVLANDGVAGGPSLAVMAIGVQNGATGTVGQPLQGALGQLTVQADGSFTYAVGAGTGAFAALAEGQTATETFVYTPSANGAGGNPQTLTLTLTGANDAPIAAADAGSALSADVKTPITGNVLANDRDPDAGATLAVTAVRAGSGQLAQGVQGAKADGLPVVVGTYGMLTMNSDGAYSYVLDVADPDTVALVAGQTGVETFTYTVSDGKLSTTAVLTFSVAGFDRPPAPTGATDGNDTITGTVGVDMIAARGGDDLIEALFGADVVDGGIGNDTISYARSGAGVVVDLADSSVNVGGDAEGDVLTSIENIIGSPQSDTLSGDARANRLTGGAGGDTLQGRGGADRLDGGDGTGDWASYRDSDASVTVDLVTGTGAGGHAEGDTLVSIDSLLGSAFNDELRGDDQANFLAGSDGDDFLFGRGGDDTLRGGAGADVIDGGAGFDTVTFSGLTTGVEVNLATNIGLRGEAAGDTYVSIEGVIGSSRDDTFLSGTLANHFVGGGGVDTLSYVHSDAAVTVNLATRAAAGGYAAGDTFTAIRNLTGSDYDDSLTGDHNANALIGGNGHDVLVGGAGADALDGGSGIDTADYGATGATEPVSVSLLTGLGSGNDADGDVLTSIENLVGTRGADTLEGNGAANRLVGGAGADTLRGDGGNDTLDGGGGIDQFDGGLGTDTVTFAGLASNVSLNFATSSFGGQAAGETFVSIEGVIGTAHADVLIANDDGMTFDGGAGADTLTGGAGADRLTGGAGADLLEGGAGVDRFLYMAADELGDTIRDFVSGTDRMVFDYAVFGLGTGLGVTVDGMTDFVGDAAPAVRAARATFLYDTDAGQLFWDADGTGTVTGAVLVATFEGAPALIANDIFLG